jgi:hypothetical protein
VGGLNVLELNVTPDVRVLPDVNELSLRAGRGVIVKKLLSNIRLNGYVHYASDAEPQDVIKSANTDHVAIHKGQALRHVRAKKL